MSSQNQLFYISFFNIFHVVLCLGHTKSKKRFKRVIIHSDSSDDHDDPATKPIFCSDSSDDERVKKPKRRVTIEATQISRNNEISSRTNIKCRKKQSTLEKCLKQTTSTSKSSEADRYDHNDNVEVEETSDASSITGSENDRLAEITIMRIEDHKTKIFPCGYCPQVTWHTKPFDHFRKCHSDEVNIAHCNELHERENDEQYSEADVKDTREKRIKLRHLILNTSSYHHNQNVIKEKQGDFFTETILSFLNRLNGT